MVRFFSHIAILSLLPTLLCAQISKYIVVDQFGYRKDAVKVAFIRDPQTGFDAAESFTPGSSYALINEQGNTSVYTAAPVAWNSGTTDASSGDKVWQFDFSSVTTEGTYHVKDLSNNARSASFVIADTVYKSILKAAMRMFYYNRSGIAKSTAHAGTGYADAASHLGSLQDKNARLYNNNTAGTEKDLYGGWYDAGDFNQYTPWTANYVVALLHAYQENPTIWTDDYNIPESGNGVPDILDEVKWGMDWLLRMSQSNGSSLSILERDHASPPSSATGQSVYGPATTNATLRSAAAFALGSKVFNAYNSTLFGTYASTLQSKAIDAWTWANSNPNVTFDNSANGVGAGNQETDNLGRSTAKLGAAVYLYELTGNTTYRDYFDANYDDMPLTLWSTYASQYFLEQQEIQMYYSSLSSGTGSVKTAIRNASNTAFNETGNFFAAANDDPYRTYIKDYNWGSNQYKSNYGQIHWLFAHHNYNSGQNNFYLSKAEEYLHYIHGANPLGWCYLTNMGSFGAEKSINEIYHTWFNNGTAFWDRVGTSTYGPPPGYLAGGANVNYSVDGCCPSSCGSSENNALCTAESTAPPDNQPAQKSYKDFNTGWPLNSWQITEPSLGYQTAYVRLLSKYTVLPDNSTATKEPQQAQTIILYPNPTNDRIELDIPDDQSQNKAIRIYNAQGILVLERNLSGKTLSVQELKSGVYLMEVHQGERHFKGKFVKE